MSYAEESFPISEFLVEVWFEMPETRLKLLLDLIATAIIGAAMFLGRVPGEWAVAGIVAINAGLSVYLGAMYKAAKEAEKRQSQIKDYES